MIPRVPGDPPRDLSKALESIRLQIDDERAGQRVDAALATYLKWRSRTSVRKLIEQGYVEVRGLRARPATRLHKGDIVEVRIPPTGKPQPKIAPDDEGIRVIYEDRWMVAVDKPAGLAVHPAGKRVYGTLIQWLHTRYRNPDQPQCDVVPRLLHRIDRETSGVVAAGLEDGFQGQVGRQFEDREVSKTYLAVVHGVPNPLHGNIDLSIGPARRSKVRLKLEARQDGSGMSASTVYRTLEQAHGLSLIELCPQTGRTHQLRVHMSAIGCPLVGDKLYGPDEGIFLEQLDGELSQSSRDALILDRHALHAHRLRFFHVMLDKEMEFVAPLPADMAGLLSKQS